MFFFFFSIGVTATIIIGFWIIAELQMYGWYSNYIHYIMFLCTVQITHKYT